MVKVLAVGHVLVLGSDVPNVSSLSQRQSSNENIFLIKTNRNDE